MNSTPVAILEHLTGRGQGTTTWVREDKLNVMLSPGNLLSVSVEEPADDKTTLVAYLKRLDGTYEIEAIGDKQMWVNGRAVRSSQLNHHDVIEFTDAGPLSRVYLYSNGQSPQVCVADILSDAGAYLRTSRRPLSERLTSAVWQVLRRLAGQTTMLFRVGVIIALTVLGLVAYQQSRISALLRQQIEAGSSRLESISQLLAEARKEALTPEDLSKLRTEITGSMASARERLTKLELRSTANPRVIQQARQSVLFLQGSYAFRDKATGNMLRHTLSQSGKIMVLPNGVPLLSLKGDGPVAVRQFTGTGFVIGDDRTIVTSRHVGRPWSDDANLRALLGQGLEPQMMRFIAHLPNAAKATSVALISASKTADVAVLRMAETAPGIKGLELAERTPQPGEEVILMGYPTGIRSMLAQAGAGFIEKLQADKVTDFWKIAERLSAAGRIVPLASRGIIGRTSAESIVYDAETTRGGSGGPLLDVEGRVVAINSAILPEYGGSNIGVPVDELRRLLAEAKSTTDGT